MTEASKKPKRVRRAAVDKTKTLSKQELIIAAGRVQHKLNQITTNHDKALTTASTRINVKYSKLVAEELLGLDERVQAHLELPGFYGDVDVTTVVEPEVTVEEAAE